MIRRARAATGARNFRSAISSDSCENLPRPWQRIAYRRVSASVLALCFLGAASMAVAADADAYRNVAASLATLGRSRLILAATPQFFDPAFATNDPASTGALSGLLSPMLGQSLIARPGPQSLDGAYAQILRHGVWASVPLGQADRAAREKDRALLFSAADTPTTSYQRYLDLKAALAAIDQQIQTQPGGASDAELQQQRAQAAQDLKLSGHAATFAPAEARFRDLSARASYNWLDTDRARLSASQRPADGGVFFESDLAANLDDIGSQPWTAMNVDALQAAALPGSGPFGGTVRDPLDWWSIPAAQGAGLTCGRHLPAGKTRARWEAVVVDIRRPWLDTAVFDSRAWRLAGTTAVLSDGADNDNAGPAPEIITALIVARNVEISGDGISGCVSEIRSALRNRADIAFGPFAVAGAAQSPSRNYLMPQIYRDSIRVPFMQIIGYVTVTLPLMPNPNPDFVW
jgi:hypothetical protein